MSTSTKIEEIKVGSKCLPVVDKEARAKADTNATRLNDMDVAHNDTIADNHAFKAEVIQKVRELEHTVRTIVDKLLYKSLKCYSVTNKGDLPYDEEYLDRIYYVSAEDKWYYYYLDVDNWVELPTINKELVSELNTLASRNDDRLSYIEGVGLETPKLDTPKVNTNEITPTNSDKKVKVNGNEWVTGNSHIDGDAYVAHDLEARRITAETVDTSELHSGMHYASEIEATEVASTYVNASDEVNAPLVKGSKFMDKDTGDYIFFNPDEDNMPCMYWKDPYGDPDDEPYIERLATYDTDIQPLWDELYYFRNGHNYFKLTYNKIAGFSDTPYGFKVTEDLNFNPYKLYLVTYYSSSNDDKYTFVATGETIFSTPLLLLTNENGWQPVRIERWKWEKGFNKYYYFKLVPYDDTLSLEEYEGDYLSFQELGTDITR